jgi:hypothetical protein
MTDGDLRERIKQRAYLFWEEEGRPAGRAEEHWLRAEADTAGAWAKIIAICRRKIVAICRRVARETALLIAVLALIVSWWLGGKGMRRESTIAWA